MNGLSVKEFFLNANFNSPQDISMPIGSHVFHTNARNHDSFNRISLWATIRQGAAIEDRTFVVMLDNMMLPSADRIAYIATISQGEGAFVLHVFELIYD